MEQKINLVATFKITTRCTQMWLGKIDKEGNNVDERTYSATVRFWGHEIASTDFATIYKTEKAAINAALKKAKRAIK